MSRLMTKDEGRSFTARNEQAVLTPALEKLPTQFRLASVSPVAHESAPTPSATPGSAYSLNLHIEELVLRGFAPCDRDRIGESFETELNRLFSDHVVPPALSRGGRITLPKDLETKFASDARPEAIGTQIARVIFRSLSHE